jgi:biotin carboxyl carrier protein
MLFEISIEGSTAKVGLTRLFQGESHKETYESRFSAPNDKTAVLIVESRDSNFLVVSINNRVYQVKMLRQSRDHVDFLLNGREVTAVLGSNLSSKGKESQARSDIATVNELVTSNFPAKVVSVPAEKGSTLKEGDTILVLEAMKMEARIKAPRIGTVVEVYVKEGEMVSRGSKLVRLKFLPK